MKNVSITESIINFMPWRREPDGRVTIPAVLPGGETFELTIWTQVPAERKRYIEELVAKYPGIAGESEFVRKHVLTVARETKIDLRFNTCGPVNGRALSSARLWRNGNPMDAVTFNLFEPKERDKRIEYFVPLVVGRAAKKKQREYAKSELQRLFMKEVQRVLAAPPVQVKSNNGRNYRFDDRGIWWLTREQEIPLTNFTATIVAEIVRDDGSDKPQLDFEIEVTTAGGRKQRCTVTSSDFREMNWPLDLFGTRGRLEAGNATKDNARSAILTLSGEPPIKRVYIHTGWIKREANWAYLHAGGAITAEGLIPVEVALDGPLSKYRLPAPPHGAALSTCIRACLKMLRVAPAEITFPPFCGVWRSVLNRSDSTITLVGPSGAGKSELLALCLQYFGPEMVRTEIVFHWNSTENAIGEGMFLAKDAMLGIDDFKLQGNSTDDRLCRKADETIQGAGNGGGKHRMKAAGGLRESHPPRATLITTGEQIPGTMSCRARQFICKIGPKDIDFDVLTMCQDDARNGAYAGAMSAYLQWLAKGDRIERVRADLEHLVPKLRARASSSPAHRRTPGIVANLYAGLLHFLEFAVESGAISSAEQRAVQDEAWAALGRQAERQRQYLEATDPAARYIELLESSLASGDAHLVTQDGGYPGDELAAACGWWRETPAGAPQPQGTRIGFLVSDGVALIPDAAIKVIRRAAANGEAPVGSENDLRERLFERGILIVNRGENLQRRTVQRRLVGKTYSVLLLRPEVLSLSGALTVLTASSDDDANSVFDVPAGVSS